MILLIYQIHHFQASWVECRKALDNFRYGDVHAVVHMHKGQGPQPFLARGRTHVVAKSAGDAAASFAFTACHGKSAGDSEEDMNTGEAVGIARFQLHRNLNFLPYRCASKSNSSGPPGWLDVPWGCWGPPGWSDIPWGCWAASRSRSHGSSSPRPSPLSWGRRHLLFLAKKPLILDLSCHCYSYTHCSPHVIGVHRM